MSREDKLSLLFKLDKIRDGLMYDILSVTDDKTNLLKNALFYYLHEIEKGNVIDRSYPYNKVNIRLDIVEENISKNTIVEEIGEVEEINQNEYEIITSQLPFITDRNLVSVGIAVLVSGKCPG